MTEVIDLGVARESTLWGVGSVEDGPVPGVTRRGLGTRLGSTLTR